MTDPSSHPGKKGSPQSQSQYGALLRESITNLFMKPRPSDQSNKACAQEPVSKPDWVKPVARPADQEADDGWHSDPVKRRLNYGEGQGVSVSGTVPPHENVTTQAEAREFQNGSADVPVEQMLKTLHEDEAAQAEARVTQLEDICVSLEAGSSRIAQLEGYIIQLESEKATLEEKVKGLEEETLVRLTSLTELVKVQEDKCKKSAVEITTLRDEVSRLQAENTKLLSTEKGRSAQISSTSSRCTALEAEVVELVKKKEAAEGMVVQLQHEVEGLISGTSDRRPLGRSLSADSRAPHTAVVDAHALAAEEARIEQDRKREKRNEELHSELVEAHLKASAAESRVVAADHSAHTFQRELEDERKKNSNLHTLVAALEAAQSAAIQDLCARGEGGVNVGRQLAQSLRIHQEVAMSQEGMDLQTCLDLHQKWDGAVGPSSVSDMFAQLAVQQQLMAKSLATMRQMTCGVMEDEKADLRETSTNRSFSFSPERSKDVEASIESQRASPVGSHFGSRTTLSDRIQNAEQSPFRIQFATDTRMEFGNSESSHGPVPIIDSV